MLLPNEDQETIQQLKNDLDSAHLAWQHLLRRHWKIREDDIYHLEADLARVQMGDSESAAAYIRRVEKLVARLNTFGVQIPERKLVWSIVAGLTIAYKEIQNQWRAHKATNNPLSLVTIVDLIQTLDLSLAASAASPSPSLPPTSSSLSPHLSLLGLPLLEAHALQRRPDTLPKLTPAQFAEYCSMQTCHRCGQRGHIQRQCPHPSPSSTGAGSMSSSSGLSQFHAGPLRPSLLGGGDGSGGHPPGGVHPHPGGTHPGPPHPAGSTIQNNCITWTTAASTLPQGSPHLSFHMTSASSLSSSSPSSHLSSAWAWDSCADMHITSQAHLFHQLTYLPSPINVAAMHGEVVGQGIAVGSIRFRSSTGVTFDVHDL